MTGCQDFWTSIPVLWWHVMVLPLLLSGLAMIITSFFLFGLECYTSSTPVLLGWGVLTLLIYGVQAASGYIRYRSNTSGKVPSKMERIIVGIANGTTWADGASAWWFVQWIIKQYGDYDNKNEDCQETPNTVAFVMMIVRMTLLAIWVLTFLCLICWGCFKCYGDKRKDQQNA